MPLRTKLWYLTPEQQTRELRGLYNRMVFAPAEPPRSPQLGSFALNPARPGARHPEPEIHRVDPESGSTLRLL